MASSYRGGRHALSEIWYKSIRGIWNWKKNVTVANVIDMHAVHDGTVVFIRSNIRNITVSFNCTAGITTPSAWLLNMFKWCLFYQSKSCVEYVYFRWSLNAYLITCNWYLTAIHFTAASHESSNATIVLQIEREQSESC